VAGQFAVVVRVVASAHDLAWSPYAFQITGVIGLRFKISFAEVLMRFRFATLLFVMLAVSGVTWAQKDPLIGKWKLDLSKSTYSPGPAMRSEILTFEPFGKGGVKVTVDQVDSQGKKILTEYSGNFDEKDMPIHGVPEADTVALKRIDANTTERIYKKDGKVISRIRRVVSKDGKMLTNIASGKNGKDEEIHNVTVFERL
jgi:hypothetical protein